MADIYAPATGEKIAVLRMDTEEDLHNAVQKAAGIQKQWAGTAFATKRRMLLRMRDYLVSHADEAAGTIADCTGKTLNDALATEVLPATLAIGYYLKAIGRLLKPQRLRRSSLLFFNKQSYLLHEPWGVIGIISPWNYPFGIPFHEVVMALAAGNAVVVKVATQAQPVGDLLAALAGYAGLPDGLLAVVHLPGSVAGEAFLHSGIHKLFFTGSVAVGRQLMEMAAERLIPVSLELGGNDAMIVCSDADMYRAAAGAVWGGISNSGQSCGGVERIYVMEEVYGAFMKELETLVSGLRQGRGLNVDFGSLTTAKQRETVEAHIDDALKKGATIRVSSPKVEGGVYHQAVVLENCTHDMEVMKDETFGPVLAVCKVKSEDQAVAMANDSYLGLTASVWTKSRRRARRLAARLEAGAVTINDHLMSHGMAETPWGGYKMSSVGRSHGGPGLQEVFQSKVVVYDVTHFLPRNIWWHPYSERTYNGLKAAMLALFGRGVGERISNAVKLAGFYLQRVKR